MFKSYFYTSVFFFATEKQLYFKLIVLKFYKKNIYQILNLLYAI